MYMRRKTLGRYGKPLAPTVKAYTFPAAVEGVNAVDSLMGMSPQSCIYTYNLMPSEYGMRLRKGYREWAKSCVESPQRAANIDVRSIIPFESNIQDAANDRLFAVTAEGIWNVTAFNTTAPEQEVVFATTGDQAGFGVFAEFTGDAAGNGLRGHYLFYADGLNGIYQYEEATDAWSLPTSGVANDEWYYIDPTDGTTRLAFPVDDVAFVMIHKQRIWVILEDDDDAYYLPVASVTGQLTKFTFGSKLPHGGDLVGLYSWTVDGGDGVDDMLVALSRGGDVIVYKGDDPEITATGSNIGPWATRGSWFIGEIPDSRRVVVDYGPDMYILSVFGITSLSQLLQGAPAFGASPSYMINRFLRPDVERGSALPNWQLVINPSDGFLHIITPKPFSTPFVQYAQNLQTKAWGFWEGVPIISASTWSGEYYIGGEGGVVYVNDGARDGEELLNANAWQDAPTGVVPAEWTVPTAGEFACDGAQLAETEYETTLRIPTVIGVMYTVSYSIKDAPAGQHKLTVGGVDVMAFKTGVGVYTSTFAATSAETVAALVGDVDFIGAFYNVNISVESSAGQAIDFRVLTAFQAPAKHAKFSRVGLVRTVGVYAGTPAFTLRVVYDYSINLVPAAPAVPPNPGDNVWDSALWDTAIWDSEVEGRSELRGGLGVGRTFAVVMNGNANSRITIVGWDALFTVGGYL